MNDYFMNVINSDIDALSFSELKILNILYRYLSLATWSRSAVALMRQPVTDLKPFQPHEQRPSRSTRPLSGEPT